MCVQFILGFTGFLYPGYSKAHRDALSPWHVFLGRITFTLGLATMAVSICATFKAVHIPEEVPNHHWRQDNISEDPRQILEDAALIDNATVIYVHKI